MTRDLKDCLVALITEIAREVQLKPGYRFQSAACPTDRIIVCRYEFKDVRMQTYDIAFRLDEFTRKREGVYILPLKELIAVYKAELAAHHLNHEPKAA